MQIILILVTITLTPTPAYAYIGPGAGLGAIATLVAIILGFLLLVVGFLWYPLRRTLKKLKSNKDNSKTSTECEGQ